MNGPKRHHYLPQFYLEGFCRDGHLWVFDREANELRRQTPVNTAVMKQYYTVEDEGGEKNNDIELFLSQIESVSKPVVQKVVSKAQMSSEDKEVMSVFIAFLMNRVPDFEKSINKAESHVIQKIMDLTFSSEERAEALMKRYVNATGDQSEVSAKDLVEFHRSGAYTLEIHRNESLRLMLELSVNIAKYLIQMDWIFFHAPKKTSFVTSDNPVFIVPPKDWDPDSPFGIGLITQGARKVVPITQGVCLVMYDHGERTLHSDLSRDLVRGFNKSIAYNSDRFLIGRDEALVLNLARTMKLAEWKNNGRIQIS